ncbi:MAG TPA: FAD-dependent monooxygenase [Microlunatus sp.]|nr:FAD-dependent monooxygenase [Microlunatus sp.]
MTSVLVSGASIAGPALASWLHRHGFEVTVIERADELRSGGQNVDVRGAGRDVARRMGLEDAIRAASTGEAGVRFVDVDDRIIASFAAGSSDSDGPTAELEILRGDLARLLVEQSLSGWGAAAEVAYVFGDHITGLDDHGTGVRVTFARGATRSFDLVVAADGIRSSTRALVLGDEPVVKPLGMYTAYLTIPRTETDTAWARWFNAPGGRTSTLRPDNVGTTRATLSFMSEPRGYERWDGAGQRDVLRQRFAGVSWEVPRILDALDGTEVYFEAISQVQAPRWSVGRTAVLGDAAYCASPISGMGTSLALAGAYVLAGELATRPDHVSAFAAYESIMRPYVEQAQQLPPGTPRLANPQTRAGIAGFNTILRVASTKVAQRAARTVFSPKAERIELPTYRPATAPTL